MSAVAKNSPTDSFDDFWNAVLMDSKEFDLSMLHDNLIPKEESREINFDKLENRLAYLHRFGKFNIHLSEKCIANFLENYSGANHLFLKNDLNICSLTNGPGLDLIGLFKSISKSSIRLKNVPDLKLIALYNTWWNISHRLFTDFYKVICSSFEKNSNKPQLQIDGLLNDFYSELSSEVKVCISDSDILLMFKVFYSAKATFEKALNSMKEIFTLLKPGSFVFFLGSKTNTKELVENAELKNLVDCILGPIKISSDLQDDDVIKPAALQPRRSGYGYFVVWKKKGEVLQVQTTPKKKKKSKKNKLKNNITVTANNETNDSNDTQSEMSFNSCSEQAETFTDGCKSASCENLSTSGIKTKPVKKDLAKEVIKHFLNSSLHNLSANSSTEFKQSTSCKDIAFNSKHFNESRAVSHADLFRSHSVMEINKKHLGKKTLNSSMSDLTSLLDKMQIHPAKVKSKSTCSLDENNKGNKNGKDVAAEKKDFNPAKFQDDLLRNLEIDQKPKLENISNEMSLDETKVTKSKKNKSQSIMNEKSSLPPESVTENKMQSNLSNSKECLWMGEQTLVKSRESKHNFDPLLRLKLEAQNISSEISQDKENKSCEKNKSQTVIHENSTLPKLASENEIDKNSLNHRIAVENKMQSNLIQFENCMCTDEKKSNIRVESKQDFNSLLQRCESLVASLEKLTLSVERNITSRNDQHFRCNISRSCSEYKPLPVCASSCFVHSNCRKRNYNCYSCPKCNCTPCTTIKTCEPSRAEECECSGAVVPKRVSNTSAPYVVMPITKEDILHILTSKKS